jgi:hypothetical protein
LTTEGDLISVDDGEIVKIAHSRVQGDFYVAKGEGIGIELCLGDHPIIAPLKDLGIGPAITSIYNPHVQQSIEFPRELKA